MVATPCSSPKGPVGYIMVCYDTLDVRALNYCVFRFRSLLALFINN